MAADDKRLVPHFQLLVDGSAADPELAASVIGIRVTDDMDRASRFWLHLSDVGRRWTQKNKFNQEEHLEHGCSCWLGIGGVASGCLEDYQVGMDRIG